MEGNGAYTKSPNSAKIDGLRGESRQGGGAKGKEVGEGEGVGDGEPPPSPASVLTC